MNMKTIVAIAAILVVLAAGYAVARPADGFWNGMMGNGGGMMGTGGMMGSGTGYGRGMMGGDGGYGSNHCGGYGTQGSNAANATPLTIEQAKDAAEQYLASAGNADLALAEVMEFNNHFYADVKEKSTGTHAFELIVNRYTGAVFPEMGPNMMWNTKYGHMNWNTQAQTTVTKEQALKNAQAYLDKTIPGTKADDADAFYGYYTVHVLKDSKTYGMLGVNAYTGAVWYHNWHGTFVKFLEVD
ncbi:MAG: PepSY domain-containing protein [Candidatus Methanoperedens sp.]|nr:PepSY domain-containing protein [Candidatus Methanoperedens sp.]